MTDKWPAYITKGLDPSANPEDDIEMTRRWETYNREMQALISKGGVHQDEDGWWIETATGELIGPDPEIERPTMDTDPPSVAKSLEESHPELYQTIKRTRGRPPVDQPKQPVTLRLHPETIAKFQSKGGKLAR